MSKVAHVVLESSIAVVPTVSWRTIMFEGGRTPYRGRTLVTELTKADLNDNLIAYVKG